MMHHAEDDCLPAPLTSSILRRVFADLPMGTRRAVESCLNSYTKRFMSNQDILEFLRSIADQSETLMSMFREHDRTCGQYDMEPEPPIWEQSTSASPNPAKFSNHESAPTVMRSADFDPPTTLAHGLMPCGGGSNGHIEFLIDQLQQDVSWSGQPCANFSAAALSHHARDAASTRQSEMMNLTKDSPRGPRQSSPLSDSGSSSAMTKPSQANKHKSAALPETVPLELQWEMQQWQHHSVPSPEDLVSGHSDSCCSPSSHAESHETIPFELLREARQFQFATHEKIDTDWQRSAALNRDRRTHSHAEQDVSGHDHTDQQHHAPHQRPEEQHGERMHKRERAGSLGSGLDKELRERHAAALAALERSDRAWQPSDPAPAFHALDHHQLRDGSLRSGAPASTDQPQLPEHPSAASGGHGSSQQSIPLALLWEASEWGQTVCHDTAPAPSTRAKSASRPRKAARKQNAASANAVSSPPCQAQTPGSETTLSPSSSSASSLPAAPQRRVSRAAARKPAAQHTLPPPLASSSTADFSLNPPPPSSLASQPGSGARTRGGQRTTVVKEEEEDEDEEEFVEEEEEEEEGVEVKEEGAAGAGAGKPKRKRVRVVKPSLPPTEEHLAQMSRYAIRRSAEVLQRRKEAASAAARMLAAPPARARGKGKKKGAEKEGVKCSALPAGSAEATRVGYLRYAILKLAARLDNAGKVALKEALAGYTSTHKSPEHLAVDLQSLVDAHQIAIHLPLPMHGPGASGFPFLAPPSALGHGHWHPGVQVAMHMPMPGPGFFPGMPLHPPPGFHFAPLPMHFARHEMGGGGGGAPAKRKRRARRGAERSVNDVCAVCIESAEGPLEDDRWVRCDGCAGWYHQVCVLYNAEAQERKLRFFCHTPLCQKRHSRQLNRRSRQPRAALSPLLPATPLARLMSVEASSMARSDRQVVVRQVFCAPLPRSQCPNLNAGQARAAEPLADGEERCGCCTRRTFAALQVTVTGSELLFLLLFLDEHRPSGCTSSTSASAAAPGRAVLRGMAANGLYEEQSQGERQRVEAAIIQTYLAHLARQGFAEVQTMWAAGAREHGSEQTKAVIGSAEQAEECEELARRAWLCGVEAAQSHGIISSASAAGVRLVQHAHQHATGAAMEDEGVPEVKSESEAMESASALQAFLGAKKYRFRTLQMAKHASMMLAYHLTSSADPSAAPAPALLEAVSVSALPEEEEEEEEEEMMGEPEASAEGGQHEDDQHQHQHQHHHHHHVHDDDHASDHHHHHHHHPGPGADHTLHAGAFEGPGWSLLKSDSFKFAHGPGVLPVDQSQSGLRGEREVERAESLRNMSVLFSQPSMFPFLEADLH